MGVRGQGSLNISFGSRVDSASSYIADADWLSSASVRGKFTSTGGIVTPSEWTNHRLIVGNGGNGTLHIEDGARVTTTGQGVVANSSSAIIGALASSTLSQAYVRGADSRWNILNEDLEVGGLGRAQLFVENGGEVHVVDPSGDLDRVKIGIKGEVYGNGKIKGRVESRGFVNPGLVFPSQPGPLTIEGTYDQKFDGTLYIELAGPTSHDSLKVSGTVDLDGRLAVAFINGYVPRIDDSFDILDWGSLESGPKFATFQFPTLPSTMKWDHDRLYRNGRIMIVPRDSAPGDFNYDGTIDAADYVKLRKRLGTYYDPLDIEQWRANYGHVYGSGSGAGPGTVPEPASLALWIVGACWLSARIVRRK